MMRGRFQLCLREVAARKFSSTSPKSGGAGFPLYLYGLFGSIGVAALGGSVVLIVSCEPGLRDALEAVSPPLVRLMRERIGFSDEDIAAKEQRFLIEKQIFDTKELTVRCADASVLLNPRTSLTEACQALNQAHHLALSADDLPLDFEEDKSDHDDDTPITSLERLITAHGAPSLWAEPPHLVAERQLSTRDVQQVLDQLEVRKHDLEDDLASGRRSIDDVRIELDAINIRRRELSRLVARSNGSGSKWWWPF